MLKLSFNIFRCQQPEFPPGSGRALYLPHCVDGVSYNYCDAVCTDKPVSVTTSPFLRDKQKKCRQCNIILFYSGTPCISLLIIIIIMP